MAYLAAGAIWVELALAGLEQHTLGHDGGTHGLVTSPHRAGQQDEAHQEAGGHHQTTRLHVCGRCGDVNTVVELVSADGLSSGY